MQAVKDSFYMTLRDRLAALNPARTIVVDGETRPAIVVRENTEPHFTAAQPETFYLDWGAITMVESTRPLLGLECDIWYASTGTCETGVDRGRMLAEMDDELFRVCSPAHAEMRDYRQSPSVDLGSSLFWTLPQTVNAPPAATTQKQGRGASDGWLEHHARLQVFFFLPEVNA